jgi:signal transduction histidine kinase
MDSSLKILIADDDAWMRHFFRHLLDKLDVSLVEAVDGEDALAKIESERPDLVLLDVVMPRLDGISVVQRLRGAGNAVPVIILSALGEKEDERLRGLEAGANDFLTKPCNAPEILAKVRTYLDLSRLQKRLMEEEKRRATTTLVRGLSHQFNNILCGLSGAAQLLDARMEAVNPLRKYVETILENAQRAATISQQLVTFAGARRDHHPSLSRFSECLTLAWKTLRAGSQQNHQLVVSGTTPLGAFIPASPTDLQAILYQLLNNAMRAMPGGGRMDLVLEAHDDRLVVHLSDEGVGMDDDDLKRAFDPFFSAADRPTDVGMGLPVVRSLLEQCGASIELRSRKSQGTTVVLEFPVLRQEEFAA